MVLFGYFLRSLLKKFLVILAVVVVLIIAIISVDLIADYSFYSFELIMYMSKILLAQTLLKIIPVCFAVSVFFMLSDFIKNQEQVAANSLGLSYIRQLSWIIFVGCIIGALCALLWLYINLLYNSPPDNKGLVDSKYQAYSIKKLKNKAIVTSLAHSDGGKLNNIFIVEIKPKKISVWQAQSAMKINESTWHLSKGNIYNLDHSHQKLSFDELNYYHKSNIKNKIKYIENSRWSLINAVLLTLLLASFSFNCALLQSARADSWWPGCKFFIGVVLYFAFLQFFNLLSHLIMIVVIFLWRHK